MRQGNPCQEFPVPQGLPGQGPEVNCWAARQSKSKSTKSSFPTRLSSRGCLWTAALLQACAIPKGIKTILLQVCSKHAQLSNSCLKRHQNYSTISALPLAFLCFYLTQVRSLHFCQKCPILRPKKWHFWWQNQNSKTTFIVQTFPKYCRKGFHFIKLSLLSPILAKFQFCWFSGLFWAFFPCKKCKK